MWGLGAPRSLPPTADISKLFLSTTNSPFQSGRPPPAAVTSFAVLLLLGLTLLLSDAGTLVIWLL